MEDVEWCPDDNVQKLVMLITNGPPSGLLSDLNGPDTWQLGKRFQERRIALSVVGVQLSIAICSDFYTALSQRTGAQYVPFDRFSNVLDAMFVQIFFDGENIFEFFRSLNSTEIQYGFASFYLVIQSQVADSRRECTTINDIRRAFCKYIATLS